MVGYDLDQCLRKFKVSAIKADKLLRINMVEYRNASGWLHNIFGHKT